MVGRLRHGQLTVQDIITIIEDFRGMARENVATYDRAWFDAGTDEEKRRIAYNAQQISTGQMMVLNSVLEEIAKQGGKDLHFCEPPLDEEDTDEANMRET